MPERNLRKVLRSLARTGQGNDVWPVALLVLAVLLPALGLLWFMAAAMSNERLAARQKLADAYRGQLEASRETFERSWQHLLTELERRVEETTAPAEAFQRAISSGRCDALVILDPQGRIQYPNTPIPLEQVSKETPDGWAEANRSEFLQRDYVAAAAVYKGLFSGETNSAVASRALQGWARCLVQAGQTEAAVGVVTDLLHEARFRHASDLQGRLVVANAELMVLELLTNHASSAFQLVAARLQERLNDYRNPALASPQRRFLMKELRRLWPAVALPLLPAEELAAEVSSLDLDVNGSALQRTSLPDIWSCPGPNMRVVALFRSSTLQSNFAAAIHSHTIATNATAILLPPDQDNAAALVSIPLGHAFPGWRLALNSGDRNIFEETTRQRRGVYLWSSIFGLSTVSVLALLAIRLLRRQTAVARLKNNLAATVSHELKTPLASMRVLVDTLLDSPTLNEKVTREYLGLIARENERLSRLIQNFLTFSRLERREHNFQIVAGPVEDIIKAAVGSVQERFKHAGCQFELRVESGLPQVFADADAITTVLINLLDNAHKFSEDIKHIVLSAQTAQGCIVISVKDNGIGMGARDRRRIFRQFYQAEHELARRGGGCGLGLSIVQSIVAAHGGRVEVESAVGLGSTFSVYLPLAPGQPSRQEAIAG